jgi:hypothetical protein
MEVTTQAVQGALDVLMAIFVHCSEQFQEKRGTKWDVEVPVEGHQPINEGPRGRALIGDDLLLDCDQRRVLVMCLMKTGDEVEPRP